MLKRLSKFANDVPIIFSGPYSYSGAAVEAVFAALKLGELNPDRRPTGKKYVVVLDELFIILFFLSNIEASLILLIWSARS